MPDRFQMHFTCNQICKSNDGVLYYKKNLDFCWIIINKAITKEKERKEKDVADEYSKVLYETFPCVNTNINKH